jgi:SSS family solute:Na+ symporter
VGFVLGLLKLGAQIVSNIEIMAAVLPGWFVTFGQFNFLYFAVILFTVTVVLVVTISLLTAPPSAQQIQGLTYATVTKEQRHASRRSWNARDVILTAIVLGMILCVYLYFTG